MSQESSHLIFPGIDLLSKPASWSERRLAKLGNAKVGDYVCVLRILEIAETHLVQLYLETAWLFATTMSFTLQTFLILLFTILIITVNVVILLVLFKTDQMEFVNKYFFVSLTLADLFIGVFVAPFSFWTSMFDDWIYGDKFCHVQAYLATIFWIASVYSLMWISIDHYVAIRKPERYESLMTPMRCICWVAFVWLAALSFCLPPLFGASKARFYDQAYVCIIDWDLQKAYFITSGTLIIIPPLIALSFSNLYIFTSSYRIKRAVYEKCTDSNSRPEKYAMSFIIGLLFLVSWMPWCLLQLTEIFLPPEEREQTPSGLHFSLMWLAVGNSAWKGVVYTIMDHDFRVGLKILSTKLVCKWTK